MEEWSKAIWESDIPLEPPLDRFVSDGKRHHLTSNETGCLHITHLVAMDTCQPGLLTCSKHHTLYGHVYKVVAFSWRGIDLAKTGNQLIIKSYKAVVRVTIEGFISASISTFKIC